MVGIIFCFSVVANINMACCGGSSRVFKKALKAAELSICTSSIIYTLNFPFCGGIRTCSISERISATELFDAASNSKTLKAKSSLGSIVPSLELIFLANMRAQVVFPTPLGPQKSMALAILLWSIAF